MSTDRPWVGRSLPRAVDDHLLRGLGRFVDDYRPEGCLHAAFVRSPIASGVLKGLRVGAALDVPGVRAVITGQDMSHLSGIEIPIDDPHYVATTQPHLAVDRIRFQGEPVAIVLASDRHTAEDGVDQIVVDYEELQPVVSLDDALAPGADLVHDDAGTNVLMTITKGDDALWERLSSASTVVDLGVSSERVTASPLEGRACLANYDTAERRLTLRTSTQQPHLVQASLAAILGLSERDIRVVTGDVGGAFGQKLGLSREEVVVSFAALHLRAPVKWVEDREENLGAGPQGHEQRYQVRAGFDSSGKITGLAARIDCNTGAYSAHPWSCALEPGMAAAEFPGPYILADYRVEARAVASNKPPTAAYRGVSRPMITLVMERVMDEAAQAMGLSRDEVRRRNLIPANAISHRSAAGLSYDRGSQAVAMERCLELIGFEQWPQRQADALDTGRLIGLGIATLSEHTGYGTDTFVQRKMHVIPGFESADISMDATGKVTLRVGTVAQGQGHRTTMAQLVADALPVTPSDVRVVAGDTDQTPFGWGAFASRSAVVAGSAAIRAARGLAEHLLAIAAHLLDTTPDQVQNTGGAYSLLDDPKRAIALADLAWIAHNRIDRLPKGMDPALVHSGVFEPENGAFSNATHATVVEVDPATGTVDVLQYVVAEDCGRIINAGIVNGQVRGGIAMGYGSALYEHVHHDDRGQCQSTSFVDYLLPTASDCFDVQIEHIETPTDRSESGAKGVGESGTIGAPAAIVGGINDALRHLGITFNSIPVMATQILEELLRIKEQQRSDS